MDCRQGLRAASEVRIFNKLVDDDPISRMRRNTLPRARDSDLSRLAARIRGPAFLVDHQPLPLAINIKFTSNVGCLYLLLPNIQGALCVGKFVAMVPTFGLT